MTVTVQIVTVIAIPTFKTCLISLPSTTFPPPAALSPSAAQALVEPLPLELAYLLFTTEGYKQTSTLLEADYLNCFGKKLDVLAEHHGCSVPNLIQRSTPLEVSRMCNGHVTVM